MTLSDSDIEDLSAYYASLESKVGLTQDKYLDLGRNIYRGGNMEVKFRHASAVTDQMDKEIMLRHSYAIGATFTIHISTIENFQASVRSNDYNKMIEILSRMTDEEMKAVASYIEGLY